MCVCGWQLIALAVFCQLLIIAYSEYEGRRRAHAALLQARRGHVAVPERRARHRAGRRPEPPR